jgi:cold shock CspA family protein
MAPKVRIGVEYEIFYGLSKALNVGRHIRVKRPTSPRQIGTIISIDSDKGFGFIRGGERQSEYYFKIAEFKSTRGFPPRVSQKVSFEVQVKYAKPRAVGVVPTR